MKRACQIVEQWVQAAWQQGLGWAACRSGILAKYEIDSRPPARYVERVLRRKIRKDFRATLN
jgi:hypothetical protein